MPHIPHCCSADDSRREWSIDVLDMNGQADVTVYSNPLLQGDLCIQIFWDKETVANQGSRLGVSLAQALKRFGLVDQSVWIRIENEEGLSNKAREK